jgi:hypothetical protein
MTSQIMDRSLDLSRIRRLDKAAQAADKWLEEETRYKVIKRPEQTVSHYISTTVFKECHQKDRTAIVTVVASMIIAKTCEKSRQKKEPPIVFFVHLRDAIINTINKQRKPLAAAAIRQIKKGEWVDHIKKVPSVVLIHGIVPFLQAPVENPPKLSYVFEFFGGNRADAFAQTYLDSYVGSQSRAGVRFQILKDLFTDPEIVNSQEVDWSLTKSDLLLAQTGKLLAILARESIIKPACFALCSADKDRLTLVMQRSTQRHCTTLENALPEMNRTFYDIWHKVYDPLSVKKLSEKEEFCLTRTVIPMINLLKEIQKMKNELVFRSSLDLLDKSPTIDMLPGKGIVRGFLVPHLTEHDFESLKGVNRAFYSTLSADPSANASSRPAVTHRSKKREGTIDSLTAFFAERRGGSFNGKKEKAYAEDFRRVFSTLPPKEQRTYKKLLWVAGGHQGQSAWGEPFADRTISKKCHVKDDRTVLLRAYEMMLAREKLKEFAERFDGPDVDDVGMEKIQCDYMRLPPHIRGWIEKLAYIFINGDAPRKTTSGSCYPNRGAIISAPIFTGRSADAKAYALACRLLAEGNFELLPKAARRELNGLLAVLKVLHCSNNLDPATAINLYTTSITHAKTQKLLTKAIEVLENCPGKGEKYLQSAATDKAGRLVPFNPERFTTLIETLSQFDTRVFRSA